MIFDKTGTLTVGKPVVTDELLVIDSMNMKQFGGKFSPTLIVDLHNTLSSNS